MSLSHGSKSNNLDVWAMAQSPIIDWFKPWLKVQKYGVWAMAQRQIILGFEPRLKGNFVAIFDVIKALQFHWFFTLYIYSPHYWNLTKSDFFGNSKIFVYNFWTNQVFDPPVSILPCTFLFIIFIMDHPVQYNNIYSK